MARSMTGFGRAEDMLNGFRITAELKSVNHRYLEVAVRTSRGFAFLEDAVSTRLKERIGRGKIEAYVSVEQKGESASVVELNEGFACAYIAAARRLQKKYRLKNDLSALSVAAVPGVMSFSNRQVDEEQVTADVLCVLDAAIDRFCEMRAVEGARLCADVRAKADAILEKVSYIEQASPESVAAYRRRLEDKMRELLDDKQVDEARLITETAIFADKIAVDEETVRLRSHIQQLNDLLCQDAPVGRKLDFIVQEMNREVNTTGSKAQDLSITNAVVDMKADIEKIREQIQNIE